MTDDTSDRGSARVRRLRELLTQSRDDRNKSFRELPSTLDLYRGYPFLDGSLERDLSNFVLQNMGLLRAYGGSSAAFAELLVALREDPCAARANTAAAYAQQILSFDDGDLVGRALDVVADARWRLHYYSWHMGDVQSASAVGAAVFDMVKSVPDELARAELLATAWDTVSSREPKSADARQRERGHGGAMVALATHGQLAFDVLRARAQNEGAEDRQRQTMGKMLKDLLANAAGEVQTDIYQVLLPEPVEVEEPRGRVVFPSFEAYQTEAEGRRSSSMAAQKAKLGHLAGRVLPFDPPQDPQVVFQALQAEFPYAEEANEAMAQDAVVAQQRGYAWVRHTLLLGQPGLGKTRYARRVAEISGLRYLLHPMAGQADGAAAGTSAQWSSARLSGPAQAAAHFACANAAFIADEIDKVGTSNHNGNAQDALVPFLERESAARIMDPFLEMPLDLSCMSFLFTANELHKVSGPLLDRLRVLKIPKPRPEHLPLVVRTMVADLREENGVDVRWMPDLDGDELDLIASQWKGGSMRRLRRLVEVLVAGRDGLAPRH